MDPATCTAALQPLPISHHFHGCTALLVLRFVVVKWRYIKYLALPFFKLFLLSSSVCCVPVCSSVDVTRAKSNEKVPLLIRSRQLIGMHTVAFSGADDVPLDTTEDNRYWLTSQIYRVVQKSKCLINYCNNNFANEDSFFVKFECLTTTIILSICLNNYVFIYCF